MFTIIILGIISSVGSFGQENNLQSNVSVLVKVKLISHLEKMKDADSFGNEYKVCTPHLICQK